MFTPNAKVRGNTEWRQLRGTSRRAVRSDVHGDNELSGSGARRSRSGGPGGIVRILDSKRPVGWAVVGDATFARARPAAARVVLQGRLQARQVASRQHERVRRFVSGLPYRFGAGGGPDPAPVGANQGQGVFAGAARSVRLFAAADSGAQLAYVGLTRDPTRVVPDVEITSSVAIGETSKRDVCYRESRVNESNQRRSGLRPASRFLGTRRNLSACVIDWISTRYRGGAHPGFVSGVAGRAASHFVAARPSRRAPGDGQSEAEGPESILSPDHSTEPGRGASRWFTD